MFDKRLEQAPAKKTEDALEKDVESSCCLCNAPYSKYLGQHKCADIIPSSGLACAVPVIVCDAKKCQKIAIEESQRLTCPLCVEGYQTPECAPDLVGQKRKLGLIARGGTDAVTGQRVAIGDSNLESHAISRRLFVGKLPLAMTASKLRQAFENINCKVDSVHWIEDHETGAFYGSSFCYMANMEHAQRAQALGSLCLPQEFRKKGNGKGRKKQPRLARVAFAPIREQEVWPSKSFCETEYPPIGS